MWCYLLFQNVTEGESTPYEKVFTFPTAGPDFSADAGEFITLISKSPVASTSEKITSMIANKLDLSLSPSSDDGNLVVELGLIGKAHTRTANPTGTWTKTADNRFNVHDLATCTLSGGDLILDSLKISAEVGIVPIGSDGSGSFENFAIISQNVTAEVIALWDATTRSALGNLSSSGNETLILEWGTASTDGYLKLYMHGLCETAAPVEDDVRKVTFTLKGLSNTGVEPFQITLCDDKDWAW